MRFKADIGDSNIGSLFKGVKVDFAGDRCRAGARKPSAVPAANCTGYDGVGYQISGQWS